MSRREKILEKMRQRQTGWRYRDVAKVLEHNGFELKSSRGSHRVWKHSKGFRSILKEGHGDILPDYVRDALEQIDRANEVK